MKYLFTILFSLITTIGFSQNVVKLKSTHFSQKHTRSDGSWTEFTEWLSSGCLIVFDDQRIVIYSEVKQTYDIIESLSDKHTKNSESSSFKCVDENGSLCTMSFIHVTEDGQKHSYLMLEFTNLVLMYKIYKLD
jgi:hypothetical protein